ncbi:MAG: cold shock domain-containing protein [Deltaproteobacteria bacterium]
MEEGIVDRYSEQKGYGFITRDDGEEVLVERASLDMPGYKTLTVGDRVAFEVEENIRGLKAKKVKKVKKP